MSCHPVQQYIQVQFHFRGATLTQEVECVYPTTERLVVGLQLTIIFGINLSII